MTVHYEMAARLAEQSRYDLAERQLRRSLEESPDHAASYSLLGICLARLKRPREALAAANEGLRLDPSSAFSHYARASVHAISGRHARQAMKDLKEAIRLDPTSPHQFFLLSAMESDRNRPRRSLAHAERGLQLDPTHTGCASLRALALQKLGRTREAEATIAQALRLDPNDDFTHAAQGWRLLQNKDRNAARGHFLEALRIDPQNRWAQSGLSASKSWASGRNIIILVVASNALRLASSVSTLKASPDQLLMGLAIALGLIAIAVVGLRIRDRWRDAE